MIYSTYLWLKANSFSLGHLADLCPVCSVFSLWGYSWWLECCSSMTIQIANNCRIELDGNKSILKWMSHYLGEHLHKEHLLALKYSHLSQSFHLADPTPLTPQKNKVKDNRFWRHCMKTFYTNIDQQYGMTCMLGFEYNLETKPLLIICFVLFLLISWRMRRCLDVNWRYIIGIQSQGGATQIWLFFYNYNHNEVIVTPFQA